MAGRTLAGGDERNRTADPLLAKQVLSHLSYIPFIVPLARVPASLRIFCSPRLEGRDLVGLPGIEPGTSRLSSVRSDRLS